MTKKDKTKEVLEQLVKDLKMEQVVPNVYEIVDEGRVESVFIQLLALFGKGGNTPIYLRPTDDQVIMLFSTEPITDEVYQKYIEVTNNEVGD